MEQRDESDRDAERLLNELLTRVGMIMEDVSPTALLNDFPQVIFLNASERSYVRVNR